jgi:hypothetical protein
VRAVETTKLAENKKGMKDWLRAALSPIPQVLVRILHETSSGWM